MKNISLLLLLCSTLLSQAQNLKALDEKNGFREMKFGSDIKEFPAMSPIEYESDSLIIFYKLTDDKLKIGSHEVERITYGFYKDKFYLVMIKINGYSNSRGVLDVMTELYGKGDKSNRYIEKYYWSGDAVWASYSENSITNDAMIYFSSKTISDRVKKDKEQASKKAKSDM